MADAKKLPPKKTPAPKTPPVVPAAPVKKSAKKAATKGK